MTSGPILQQGAKRGPLRRLWQAGLLLCAATAACGQATTKAATTSAPPFTVHEVAKFSTPWAMAFLPGSGVKLTGTALLTEKEGSLWLVDTATGAKQAVPRYKRRRDVASARPSSNARSRTNWMAQRR